MALSSFKNMTPSYVGIRWEVKFSYRNVQVRKIRNDDFFLAAGDSSHILPSLWISPAFELGKTRGLEFE
jgi:hypothetical protein